MVLKQMNFQKSSKGGWAFSHFQSKNLYGRFWTFKQDFLSIQFEKKKFQKSGGEVKGRSELFRKFVRFGVATRP